MAAAAASPSDSTLRVSGLLPASIGTVSGLPSSASAATVAAVTSLATPGTSRLNGVGAPARWRGAAVVIGLGSLWKSALSSCATSSSSLAILADLGGGSSSASGPRDEQREAEPLRLRTKPVRIRR